MGNTDSLNFNPIETSDIVYKEIIWEMKHFDSMPVWLESKSQIPEMYTDPCVLFIPIRKKGSYYANVQDIER